MWFERNPDKGHRDMTQNPTCVTITRSTFMSKKTILFSRQGRSRDYFEGGSDFKWPECLKGKARVLPLDHV